MCRINCPLQCEIILHSIKQTTEVMTLSWHFQQQVCGLEQCTCIWNFMWSLACVSLVLESEGETVWEEWVLEADMSPLFWLLLTYFLNVKGIKKLLLIVLDAIKCPFFLRHELNKLNGQISCGKSRSTFLKYINAFFVVFALRVSEVLIISILICTISTLDS